MNSGPKRGVTRHSVQKYHFGVVEPRTALVALHRVRTHGNVHLQEHSKSDQVCAVCTGSLDFID